MAYISEEQLTEIWIVDRMPDTFTIRVSKGTQVLRNRTYSPTYGEHVDYIESDDSDGCSAVTCDLAIVRM